MSPGILVMSFTERLFGTSVYENRINGYMLTKAADKASDRMHTSWRGGMH